MQLPVRGVTVAVIVGGLCFLAYLYGGYEGADHALKLAHLQEPQVSRAQFAWHRKSQQQQQQQQQQTSRSHRQQSRLLLIATFSYPPDHSRRHLVRSTTLRYGRNESGSPVDHIFVLGQMQHEATGLRHVLYSEQATHHDLMEVECIENCVNTGKTWEMMVKIFKTFDSKEQDPSVRCQLGYCAEPFIYDFVFKTDGDSVINIPRIVQALHEINSTDHVYFGSEYRGYMQGEGYGISWDLVDFITHDPWTYESRATAHMDGEPFEDATLGVWFWHANLTDVVHKYNFAGEIFQGQTGNLTEQRWMLMHGAKSDESFWSYFYHLMWNRTGSPGTVLHEISDGPYSIEDVGVGS